MPVYQLDEGLWFPNPEYGEPDGLLAVGGDLSPQRLLLAYRFGIFPWFSFQRTSEPEWYCPMERFVIFPDEIHISHSMKQLMRKGIYEVTFNQAFSDVIRNCSQINSRHDSQGAWLGKDMIEAYTKLHEMDRAVSVEVWRKTDLSHPLQSSPTLVGGLYGVSMGSVFMGESMFSLEPNASKIALIALAQRMQQIPNSLIDCQLETQHLRSMGGRYIDYYDFMEIMDSNFNTDQQ